MSELTAPIVFKNDEKRIVQGPVLIPNEEDTDGDVVSKEKIEEVAHQFVEDYGNIDIQHSTQNVGKMVESYVTPVELKGQDGEVIPKGSWMLGVRVTNDNVWKSVKSGDIGGFSIMAIPKAMKGKKTAKSSAKRTTLKDLGDDWLVNFVSLVDEPAVPKAKFVAIKSKKKDEEGEKSILKSIKELLTSIVEKEEPEEMEENQEPKDDEGGDITLTPEQLQKIIKETVKTTVSEVIEQMKDDEPEDDQDTNDGDDEENKDEETKEKEELEKRLQEVEKALKNRPKGIFSKSLAGQDGDTVHKQQDEQPTRDAFGRKIKK